MKRSGPEHPKMKALARTLGVPHYSAVGLLELLWHFTAKFAPQGDVGRFDNASIAEAMTYTGDPDALCNALVATGWLDACTTNRLLVHGWEEHADQGVRNTLKGRGLSFLTPTIVEPKSNVRRTRVRRESDGGRPGTGTGTGLGTGSSPPRTTHELTEAFESEFWPAYPPRNGRRDGKQEALAEWLKLRPDIALQAQILAALPAYARSTDLPLDACRWLKRRRWTDESNARTPAPVSSLAKAKAEFQAQLAARAAQVGGQS